MKFIKYSFLLAIVAAMVISCDRDDDIFSDVQDGANVRLVKDADLPVFINAEDIANSRIGIDGFSSNDDIATIELVIDYLSSSLDTFIEDKALRTIQGSEISDGRLPELNFTTQQIATAVGITVEEMAAGDQITIRNITTLEDGRIYPDPNVVTGINIDEVTGDTATLEIVNNVSSGIANAATASFTSQLVYFIACPFNADDAVGEYLITRDDFVTSLDYDTPIQAEKVDETTIRFVNLFMHPEMFDVDVVVDLASGQATVERQAAWHCDNFGCAFGEGRVDGGGFFLSCVGFVTLDLTHTVDAGSFGTFKLELQKQ